MKPPQQLIDELYLDKIRAARQMSPERKFFAGPRLFARCCRVMLDGLRHENPDADEQRLKGAAPRTIEIGPASAKSTDQRRPPVLDSGGRLARTLEA
jgi:hypothetical protein